MLVFDKVCDRLDTFVESVVATVFTDVVFVAISRWCFTNATKFFVCLSSSRHIFIPHIQRHIIPSHSLVIAFWSEIVSSIDVGFAIAVAIICCWWRLRCGIIQSCGWSGWNNRSTHFLRPIPLTQLLVLRCCCSFVRLLRVCCCLSKFLSCIFTWTASPSLAQSSPISSLQLLQNFCSCHSIVHSTSSSPSSTVVVRRSFSHTYPFFISLAVPSPLVVSFFALSAKPTETNRKATTRGNEMSGK